jgi:hypothetical protein
MKKVWLIVYLLGFAVFGIVSCKDSSTSSMQQESSLLKFIKNSPTPDSGYITKKDGLPFLLKENLTDTSKVFWNDISANDTIGKFYREPKAGHYFVYLYNKSLEYKGECHTLLDISDSGKLLRHTDFLHGNHGCCLDNYYYDGFNKVGDFFALNTCGTGAGYCAKYLWLFDKVTPQEQQKSIYESIWTSIGPESQYLSSQKEIKYDTLIMYYKLEKGELDDSSEFIVKKIERFNVKYFLKDDRWLTADSLRVQEFDTW